MKFPQQSSSTQIVLDGKYRLEERLGEGATGVVYRALHLGLKKTFAVKVLKTGARDPLSLARFQREAEALGQLRHPHVVEVTDFGIDDAAGGVPYLVMELLDGITLADVCRKQGPLLLERALPLLEAVAAAVDTAHAQGILHRDLKPGNVLLCRTGEGEPLVKVLDFGLAETGTLFPRARGDLEAGEEGSREDLTATGALLGTPLYVAPELIQQHGASRASDLYSFGVVAYEVLAGKPPFQGSTAEVLAGHLEEEPPPPAPSGVPLSEEVWQALREPLQKDPALRPASAGDVVRRVRRAAERAALAQWRTAEVPRRTRLSILLAAAVLLAGYLLPWPVLPAIERRMHDLRLRTAPLRPPDQRILLLTIDEKRQLSLVDRADEIGDTLDRVFAAGARSVAIDLLLHAKWSDSPAFSDLVLRHSETLTLAAFSEPDGRVTGTECVAGLTAAALGPDRTANLFGFVNLDEDRDGVVRKGRLGYRDRSGRVRPSWATKAAAAFRAGTIPPNEAANAFWIDSRIDWPRYQRISWRDLPAVLDRNPELFRDRLVLVGAGFRGSGDDYHRVPHRSRKTAVVSGLTLQALLVDTIAAGLPVREPERAPVLAVVTLLTGLAMVGILCLRRPGPLMTFLAVAAVLYLAASFPAFWWAGQMLPTSPLLLVLLGLSLALIVRRMLPPAPEVSS
jgi:CHASE2 domain-containing sensor protein/tRNA A-37 threonylcarbamoyl transferase component Bud32